MNMLGSRRLPQHAVVRMLRFGSIDESQFRAQEQLNNILTLMSVGQRSKMIAGVPLCQSERGRDRVSEQAGLTGLRLRFEEWMAQLGRDAPLVIDIVIGQTKIDVAATKHHVRHSTAYSKYRDALALWVEMSQDLPSISAGTS